MGEEGLIAFGGRDAFPVVRARAYSPLPSRYTDEEVALILGSVDVATPAGKRDMLVLSLFAHYGMRCGDVAALRFADVDWCSGRIAIVQAKTGLRLSLPIVDGVRFPAPRLRGERNRRLISFVFRKDYDSHKEIGRAHV